MSDPNDVGDRDDAGGEDDDPATDEAGDPATDEAGDPAIDEAGDDDGEHTAADAVEGDRVAALAEEIDDEDGEWRFGLDEVGEDAEMVRSPIEPESISLEHVAFVLVGVIGTLALLFLGI